MSGPVQTIDEFVASFVAAWPTGDASPLGAFFTEDAVYHNGPLEPVSGRAAIMASIESLMTMGGNVSMDMVNVVADGSIVMTERIDSLEADGRSVTLPVMGVFEMRDGQIAAWRDYFDIGQFTAQWSQTPA